ncbi:MAG: TetR/AcrR family transcriptional regulator [Devosia sp.]|uniref:TetR/AcrR family transcriptional regulator n=1 Tax=Devosia sp. TaxID=1871048 RepID=UPI0024CB5B7C|nr:TetR/AcrR family transcriptional regulator [Devosia sp.]UYN99219.1 MAG: TetR/AcrR family transcriptional regulator [Devosia sp.]
MAKRPLTRTDWILAGLSALAESGVEAVRVEPLARRLKTSKGSFYWHFADRPALLAAMLELWESEGTGAVIAAIDPDLPAAGKLRELVRLALLPVDQGIDVAPTEAALRAWASEDSAIAPRVANVDAQRVAYLEGLAGQLGYDAGTAAALARGLYMALLGLYATRRYAPSLAVDSALIILAEQMIAAAPDG